MITRTLLLQLHCLLVVRLPHHPSTTLPAIGTGFKCPFPHCCDKLPYVNAAGFLQHLNSRHHGEGPYSLRNSCCLPDITACRVVVSSVLMPKASPHIGSARTRNLRSPGLRAN